MDVHTCCMSVHVSMTCIHEAPSSRAHHQPQLLVGVREISRTHHNLRTTTTTISDNTTSTTTTAPACSDNDDDGYGENCAAGPDCDDSDAFYNEICPDCTVIIIPKVLRWLSGENENTRRLLVIGKRGTVFDEITSVTWETSSIAVVSKRVFFKRLMLMKVSIDVETLENSEYRVLIGECEGKLTLAK